MKTHIHIVHHSPGRIRTRVAGLKGYHELTGAIHETAGAIEGVELVRANTMTGSVVMPNRRQHSAFVQIKLSPF